MMTVTEHIRAGIYERFGLLPDGEIPKRNYLPPLESLRDSEWSEEFEQLLRARLILGGIRYGLLNSTGKRKYDRINSCISRLEEYKRTGNDELLVDVANFCMLEFEEGTHPNKHFRAGDDGEHVKAVIQEDVCPGEYDFGKDYIRCSEHSCRCRNKCRAEYVDITAKENKVF